MYEDLINEGDHTMAQFVTTEIGLGSDSQGVYSIDQGLISQGIYELIVQIFKQFILLFLEKK